MDKINELQLSLVKRDLRQYYYWKLVSEKNVLSGRFYSLHAQNIMTEHYFNLCQVLNHKDLPDDWEQMCKDAENDAFLEYTENLANGNL